MKSYEIVDEGYFFEGSCSIVHLYVKITGIYVLKSLDLLTLIEKAVVMEKE